jgi:hypothetical protein
MRCWLLPNRISGKAQVEATSQKPPRGLLHFQPATAAHRLPTLAFIAQARLVFCNTAVMVYVSSIARYLAADMEFIYQELRRLMLGICSSLAVLSSLRPSMEAVFIGPSGGYFLNVTVTGCEFENQTYAIYLSAINGYTVVGNDIINPSGVGIDSVNSHGTIDGNTIDSANRISVSGGNVTQGDNGFY